MTSSSISKILSYLHEEDLILLYCIMNLIKVKWVYIIMEHMLKSKRLVDYRFPYGGEFRNAKFERFCEKHGISQFFIP